MTERIEVACASGVFFVRETPQISHSQIALCPLLRVLSVTLFKVIVVTVCYHLERGFSRGSILSIYI